MLNPQWPGPGQPKGLHQWLSPTLFQLADLAGNAPPAAAPPPVNPMDTSTWQSGPAQQITESGGYPGMGGGEGSGGWPGGNTERQETDPNAESQSGHPNWGGMLGLLGTAAGFALPGVPLGLLGSAAGTGIDQRNANQRLADFAREMGVEPSSLGFRDFGRAMLGNSAGGLLGFGTSTNRAALQGMIDTAFRGRPDIFQGGESQPGSPASINNALTQAFQQNPGIFATSGTDYGAPPGSPQSINDALSAAFAANPGIFGGTAPDAAPAPSGSLNDAISAAFNDNPGLFSRGGPVPSSRGLLDPPGPDDQVAGLQTGEFVVKKAAAMKHRGLLDAINSGASKKQLKGLLG